MIPYLSAFDLGCKRELPFELFFFTRRGGRSRGPLESLNMSYDVGDDPASVGENESRVLKTLNRSALYLPKQIHSARVISPDRTVASGVIRGEKADAVSTGLARVAVGVLTADCVPVLIGSLDGGAVAAVHAGWRGLVGGVIAAAVDDFIGRGMSPGGLAAFIGPAIGPCCFEVGEDVARHFRNHFDESGDILFENTFSKAKIDLPAAAKSKLREAGLEEENIYFARRCTACEKKAFFSYRQSRGRTGRQLSAIAIRPSLK